MRSGYREPVTPVLIAYATRTAAAQDVALTAADTLRAAGHQVRVADLRDAPAVDDARLVIVGSGIHAGAWYPEASGWVAARAQELRSRRVAVFNTCLSVLDPAARTQARGYNSTVVQRTGAEFSESFPGRYVPEKVGFLRRLLMRTMQKPAQDHFNPELVRAWVATLGVDGSAAGGGGVEEGAPALD